MIDDLRYQGDWLADREYTVPHYFTDAQLDILEQNPEYHVRSRGRCPVCLGENFYWYGGEKHDCPDDLFGHPMLRLAKWYWISNIPWHYQILSPDDWKLDTDRKTEAREAIQTYLDRYEGMAYHGRGVTFRSTGLGTGKTMGATMILKHLVGKKGIQGWFAAWRDVKRYFEIEDRKRRDFLQDRVRYAPVLVLDEVQAPWSDRARELFADKLEDLVRPRADANLPTIITTNLTDAEMEQHYGRVFSLLLRTNLPVDLEGEEDFRANQAHWMVEEEAAANGERRPIT